MIFRGIKISIIDISNNLPLLKIKVIVQISN